MLWWEHCEFWPTPFLLARMINHRSTTTGHNRNETSHTAHIEYSSAVRLQYDHSITKKCHSVILTNRVDIKGQK